MEKPTGIHRAEGVFYRDESLGPVKYKIWIPQDLPLWEGQRVKLVAAKKAHPF